MIKLSPVDLDVMARTIYGEARGESDEGRYAVACVILNRVLAGSWYGSSIKHVCYKRYQFTCWNDNDPNYNLIKDIDFNDMGFLECYRVCLDIMLSYVTCIISGDAHISGAVYRDITNGAKHYHTKAIQPSWVAGKSPCYTVGTHHFYNDID